MTFCVWTRSILNVSHHLLHDCQHGRHRRSAMIKGSFSNRRAVQHGEVTPHMTLYENNGLRPVVFMYADPVPHCSADTSLRTRRRFGRRACQCARIPDRRTWRACGRSARIPQEMLPCDYDGIMGVPITFMDKYSPEQFEILDINPHFFTLVAEGQKKPKQLTLYWSPCQDHKRKIFREHWCTALNQLHPHAAPIVEKHAL